MPYCDSSLRYGNVPTETHPSYDQNQPCVQAHNVKKRTEVVNSTREDALVLDATIEALLKFPALRAKLPAESRANKMIVNIGGASNIIFRISGKNNRHPSALFMNKQFQKQVPEDVLNDLDRRNARTASWNTYKPGNPDIVILTNDEVLKTYRQDFFIDVPGWYQNNPGFVGSIAAYLPGYSRRRSTAVLRFGYALAPHMCLGSCLLIKVHGKWIVQRIEIADFA